MKRLWDFFLKRIKDYRLACGLFIALLCFICAAAGLAAGIMINIFLGLKSTDMIIFFICMSGYPAFLIGFFGGIIYIYRNGDQTV